MKQTKHIIAALFLTVLLATQQATANYELPNQQNQIETATFLYDFTAFVNGQQLQIDFDSVITNEIEVELYDVTGKKITAKKIASDNSTSKIIDLDQPLKKGLYILKIKINNKVVAKKVQT